MGLASRRTLQGQQTEKQNVGLRLKWPLFARWPHLCSSELPPTGSLWLRSGRMRRGYEVPLNLPPATALSKRPSADSRVLSRAAQAAQLFPCQQFQVSDFDRQ